MTRPTEPIVDWALDSTDQEGRLLKEVPPDEFQQTGTRFEEPWVRVWMNYMFNNFSAYLQHLADDPIGTVKIVDIAITDATVPTTPAEALLEWGGTWTMETATIGSSSKNIFTKTSLT